jgi:hypothetical protein
MNVAEDTLVKQAMRLHDYWHNLKESLLQNSVAAQHAYEEGHRIGWDEDRILEIVSKRRCTKHKELTHIVCLTYPISQPCLDISLIWIPLISIEVTNSHRRSV